jgi:hypothetical protein
LGAAKEVPSRTDSRATMPIPPATAAVRKRKRRARASWLLIAAFALFTLLGGSAWSSLSDSPGQDSAPNQEDSQAFAPVSDPEDEATEAPAEAEQAPVTDVAPAKDPTPGSTQNNGPTQETGVGQTPPPNAPIEPSGFDLTPVNNTASLAPQPALQSVPEQQSQEQQVASGQQAQGVVSSQPSYAVIESQAHKVSGAQKEQIFESSASPDK